jgi:hypothetical protein
VLKGKLESEKKKGTAGPVSVKKKKELKAYRAAALVAVSCFNEKQAHPSDPSVQERQHSSRSHVSSRSKH